MTRHHRQFRSWCVTLRDLLSNAGIIGIEFLLERRQVAPVDCCGLNHPGKGTPPGRHVRAIFLQITVAHRFKEVAAAIERIENVDCHTRQIHRLQTLLDQCMRRIRSFGSGSQKARARDSRPAQDSSD